MLKKLLSALLIVGLALPACAAIRPPRKSVQALADVHPDGKIHDFCTAWSTLYESKVVWLSAAHCVELDAEGKPIPNFPYIIAGKPAVFLKWDVEKDLAMFSGPFAPPLKIAFGEADVNDEVYTISYFWAGGFFSVGRASWPSPEGKSRFGLTGGPGSSGAPVLSDKNVVVGTIQFGPCQTVCPALGGATVKDLRTFLNLEMY